MNIELGIFIFGLIIGMVVGMLYGHWISCKLGGE